MTPLEIVTPHGPALAHLHAAEDPRAGLVLGHGAGGGVAARDLVAATKAALAEGVSVALVEQPYRVKGRKSPAPAKQLDAAWDVVVDHLRGDVFAGLPLITGGRSSGAASPAGRRRTRTRRACSASPSRSIPPGSRRRRGSTSSTPSTVPVLVIQGESDPFGMPPPAAGREVVAQPGTHALTGDLAGLGEAVRGWLARVLAD